MKNLAVLTDAFFGLIFIGFVLVEKKIGVTRDVGTQSTPPYLSSSSSPSPAPTPSIEERSIKRNASESPSSCAKLKSEEDEVSFFNHHLIFFAFTLRYLHHCKTNPDSAQVTPINFI